MWRSKGCRTDRRSTPGRQTAPGAGLLTGRRPPPAGTTQRVVRAADRLVGRGNVRSRAAACAAGTSARSAIPAASTWASAKPRSQRLGNGTRFSTNVPSKVVTSS